MDFARSETLVACGSNEVNASVVRVCLQKTKSVF